MLLTIQRKSFEFRVKGSKKKILVTLAFHPNAYDIALLKARKRAISLSGDPKARFVGDREPIFVGR